MAFEHRRSKRDRSRSRRSANNWSGRHPICRPRVPSGLRRLLLPGLCEKLLCAGHGGHACVDGLVPFREAKANEMPDGLSSAKADTGTAATPACSTATFANSSSSTSIPELSQVDAEEVSRRRLQHRIACPDEPIAHSAQRTGKALPHRLDPTILAQSEGNRRLQVWCSRERQELVGPGGHRCILRRRDDPAHLPAGQREDLSRRASLQCPLRHAGKVASGVKVSPWRSTCSQTSSLITVRSCSIATSAMI